MKKLITKLRNEGLSDYCIFERLVGLEKLYCIAFFGWKGTRKQKARVRYINKLIFINN